MEKLTKREKVLLGISLAGVTAVGIASIIIYKQNNTISDALLDKIEYEKLTSKLVNENEELKEELNFIKFLVIESGSVPKAKQNGENKLARKESKIKGIIDAIQKRPDDKELPKMLKKHEKEAAILRKELAKTIQLEEFINNDENIYAK